MFISWMLIIPSFQKSLIVEQFQGNYLKSWILHYAIKNILLTNIFKIKCEHVFQFCKLNFSSNYNAINVDILWLTFKDAANIVNLW